MIGGVRILTFHALDEEHDVCGFPHARFEAAVTALVQAGYRTLALADVAAALKAGQPLPDRAVCFTFDDGYRSVYTDAWPILRAHGMMATVFLSVGEDGAGERLPSMEGRTMLSWSEIRELSAAGMAFGSHALTHGDLTRMAPARRERELARSKAVIEDRLGIAVSGFAYPFGRFDASTRASVCAHYAFACADTLGLATAASDCWTLPRIETYYLRAPWATPLVASSWLPAFLLARNGPRVLARTVGLR